MNRGTRFAWALLTLAALTMLLPGGGSSAAMAAPVEATLNGLHIVLDENSGVLLWLSHPVPERSSTPRPRRLAWSICRNPAKGRAR